MTRKIIGQAVVKEMKRREWSFYKLANEAQNVTITQLKSITSGSKNYTMDSFLGVCKAFGWNFIEQFKTPEGQKA